MIWCWPMYLYYPLKQKPKTQMMIFEKKRHFFHHSGTRMFFKSPRVAMFQHLRLRCSCEAVGTYVCFVLRSIGIRFADKDECAFNNGDCEHVCVNSYLSHSCHCRGGYTIASDNRNCNGNF